MDTALPSATAGHTPLRATWAQDAAHGLSPAGHPGPRPELPCPLLYKPVPATDQALELWRKTAAVVPAWDLETRHSHTQSNTQGGAVSAIHRQSCTQVNRVGKSTCCSTARSQRTCYATDTASGSPARCQSADGEAPALPGVRISKASTHQCHIRCAPETCTCFWGAHRAGGLFP